MHPAEAQIQPPEWSLSIPISRERDDRLPAEFAHRSVITVGLAPTTELHGRSHIVYHDNWFTSLPLAVKMAQAPRGILSVGTIRTNRRHLPRDIVFPAKGANVRERGTIRCKKINVDGHDIYFTAWQDTKPVNMISPFKPNFVFVSRRVKDAAAGWTTLDVPVPTCIPCYNQWMGAVP